MRPAMCTVCAANRAVLGNGRGMSATWVVRVVIVRAADPFMHCYSDVCFQWLGHVADIVCVAGSHLGNRLQESE